MGTKLKLFTLIFIQGFILPLFASTDPEVLKAKEPCVSDYHFQRKWVPHFLSPAVVKSLEDLIEDPAQGWKILGENGDGYAAIAEKVLQPESEFPYFLYRTLIQNHWKHTVGERELKQKFPLVAKMHFSQYVEIIKTGYWPDSDQILNSYLHAVRFYKLRDITVFDAAWDTAEMNKMSTWQSLNHISTERTVLPTVACFQIDKMEAKRVITKDFAHPHKVD